MKFCKKSWAASFNPHHERTKAANIDRDIRFPTLILRRNASPLFG